MHDSLLSILLGIIEGLTEFLPVSSTAHLRIAEALLGIDLGNGFWKMYSIVIQLGAILCLPIYFRTRIARFFSTFPRGERGDRTWLNHPLMLVIVAFLFTAIPALLLTKVIGKHLESLVVMGWSLLIGGIIMWVVDAMFGTPRSGGRFQTERMEEMTTPQAIWIGICQMKYAMRGYGTSAVFEKASGKFVGYCGVVRAPENNFDELIYVYNVEMWGKGYATEAGRAMLDYVFAHSTLERIYATIHPENTASVKVAGKLGLRLERLEIEDDGMPVGYYVIERKEQA